jgi:hypothetical protein
MLTRKQLTELPIRMARRTWRTFLLVTLSSEFHKCSPRDLKEATTELLVTTVFSTMPLWIMPLLGPLIFTTKVSFVEHLVGTINGGELFVYCAALVGPLVYIITRRYGEISRDNNRFSFTIAFPNGIGFVLASAVICIFAGFAFSLMRNPIFDLHAPDAVSFNTRGIFWTSIVLYLISLYCVFSASAYRNALSEFVRDGSNDEAAFSIAFEARATGAADDE